MRTSSAASADAFAPFLHNLAEPWNAILPHEVEDKMGDFKAAEALIGCGPFVPERYEPGVKAVFARNPSYYDRNLPYIDKLEWLFVKDRSTQLSLFRAGQVDLPFYDGRIPRSEIQAFKKSTRRIPSSTGTGSPTARSRCGLTGRRSTTCGSAAPSA